MDRSQAITRSRPIVLAVLCGFATTALCGALPGVFNAQSGPEAIQASRQSGKPIMLYFTQPACVWCERVEHLLTTSEFRFTMAEHYHSMNIDISRHGDKAIDGLMRMFKVQGTPSFAFLSSRGEPICMVYGNIRNDAELVQIDSTVQRLAAGGKTTAMIAGFPSCRGKVSADDAMITSMP